MYLEEEEDEISVGELGGVKFDEHGFRVVTQITVGCVLVVAVAGIDDLQVERFTRTESLSEESLHAPEAT